MQPSHREGVYDLTDAEVEVLRLLASGLGYHDIAQIRGCKMRTVQTHAHAIYDKLRVGSQTAAARVAWEQGIISIDDAWQILQIHRMGGRWRAA